jgi:hypothetical protein
MEFYSEEEEMLRRVHSIAPVVQLFLNNEHWLENVASESGMEVEEVRSILASALQKALELAPSS